MYEEPLAGGERGVGVAGRGCTEQGVTSARPGESTRHQPGGQTGTSADSYDDTRQPAPVRHLNGTYIRLKSFVVNNLRH